MNEEKDSVEALSSWIPIFYNTEEIKKVLEMPAEKFIDSLNPDEALYSTVTAVIELGANSNSKALEIMEAVYARKMTINRYIMKALVDHLSETIEENRDAEGKISSCVLEDVIKKANSVVKGRVNLDNDKLVWIISWQEFKWVL